MTEERAPAEAQQAQGSTAGWSPTTRLLVAVALLLGVAALGIALLPLLPSVSVAGLLAYLFNPLVHIFRRRLKLSRAWAARLTFLLFLLFVVLIPAWLGTFAVNQRDSLESTAETVIVSVQDWLSRPLVLGGLHIEPQRLLEDLFSLGQESLAALPVSPLPLITTVTTNLAWGLVALVLLYYFLKDGPRLKAWLLQLPPIEQRANWQALLDEVDSIWNRFLRIQVAMFFVLGFMMLIGTLVVVALFRGGVLPWSPLLFLVLVAAVYTLVQQIDNLWLRPQLLGRHLSLHPGLVFLAMVGGLLLGGFIGALFAVPMLGSARVIGKYLRRGIQGESAATAQAD